MIVGKVVGSTNVGGIAGKHFGNKIFKSSSSADVEGLKNVGGIAGYSEAFIKQ